jgi:lantibiotic transport system ATP-binding protein
MARQATSSPIIQTRHLERIFGSRKGTPVCAVAGLDLNVPEGSIYGFLGPNGAGKTTTIRMLLGLIRPTAGQILVFGRALDRAAQGGIGALVETPSYYPHLTGRENLALVAGMRRLPKTEVQRVLGIVDLEKAANRLARHYSLGMCQRLGLAMALLGQPRLLVLDEPTNGLDPAGIHEIRALIRDLPRQQGITVFVSSHQLSEVEQIASHIGIVREGKLVFQGSAEDLSARFSESVLLVTDSPEQTCARLARLGWQSTLTEPANGRGRLKVAANGDAEVALIVQQLVQAGEHIFHASLEKPALEDIFLTLTASKEPRGVHELTVDRTAR